jgi:hypothetical protein
MSLFKITRRSQFPACLQPIKQVKGICVGGCVAGLKDLAQRIAGRHQKMAHAHQNLRFKGWICLSWKFLLKNDLMLLHEAAHLLVDSDAPDHGKEWRQAVVAIGGTYKAYRIDFRNYYINFPDYTYTKR